jgi:hypothetical protein
MSKRQLEQRGVITSVFESPEFAHGISQSSHFLAPMQAFAAEVKLVGAALCLRLSD